MMLRCSLFIPAGTKDSGPFALIATQILLTMLFSTASPAIVMLTEEEDIQMQIVIDVIHEEQQIKI
jgi:hypothetical protein